MLEGRVLQAPLEGAAGVTYKQRAAVGNTTICALPPSSAFVWLQNGAILATGCVVVQYWGQCGDLGSIVTQGANVIISHCLEGNSAPLQL